MKNKIHKYDFLIVGGGLIGSITALALFQKKFKVIVIDKKNNSLQDNRTLAVNANSIDFLKKLGIWNGLKTKPQPIDKIVIKDDINQKPLVFENNTESMGNVIFNRELHKILRKKLENLKILKTNINIGKSIILPNKNFQINNNNYKFKKVIICTGKSVISDLHHQNLVFDQSHKSYVGFFKHSMDHKNIAYEFFTSKGPLAILPVPALQKNKSTFIYSSKEQINSKQLYTLINKKIAKSHGKIIFEKLITKFQIVPHLTKNNDDFIYVGDSLKSIHPVAGQGWNLGIKDIQTLCKLLDQYPLDEKNFSSLYYSRRITESTIYLGFTSLLNFLYERELPINTKVIKAGFMLLRKITFLRDLFIKQAMGRIN